MALTVAPGNLWERASREITYAFPVCVCASSELLPTAALVATQFEDAEHYVLHGLLSACAMPRDCGVLTFYEERLLSQWPCFSLGALFLRCDLI